MDLKKNLVSFLFLVWKFDNFYICFCHILGLGFS
jgi:hypothetical protein